MSEEATEEAAPEAAGGEPETAEEPAAEDVPAEVTAMDGVESKEEAHNADRPARASGIQKHKSSSPPRGNPSGKDLSEFEVGQTIQAKVKAIASYGAFLDIGAKTDALVHVSRLSDEFVSNVQDIVQVGQEVDVRILSIDEEKGQVAVTMRSEEAESRASKPRADGERRPRQRKSGGDKEAQKAAIVSLAESGYDGDQFVDGEVMSTLDFGAFVRFDVSQFAESLEGQLEGLVHISALTAGRAASVESVVNVGDKVKIRIRNLDTDGGKISLSMISKEDEPKPRGGGEGRPRKSRSMWSPDEMGAADWKDSLDAFMKEQPEFSNKPLVIDRRK